MGRYLVGPIIKNEEVFDDDDYINDEEGMYKKSLNPPKNMIEREPEREPDNSLK